MGGSVHFTLSWCIALNAVCLVMLVVLASVFGDFGNTPFMKYGPQPSLIILGITIDTWPKYVVLQFLIMCFQVTDTVVNEFASPILGFNVYNPDKEHITEFTKLQLQFYCQSMWFINHLKSALMILVSISQIDIAVCKVVYTEITSIYTIRTLINKKRFGDLEEEVSLI